MSLSIGSENLPIGINDDTGVEGLIAMRRTFEHAAEMNDHGEFVGEGGKDLGRRPGNRLGDRGVPRRGSAKVEVLGQLNVRRALTRGAEHQLARALDVDGRMSARGKLHRSDANLVVVHSPPPRP